MIEKVSQHSLEAVRSRQLWQDTWAGVTLADNYRVEGYGVDYAARASHSGGLGQRVQNAYSSSQPDQHQQHHASPYQQPPHNHHHPQQQTQHQQQTHRQQQVTYPAQQQQQQQQQQRQHRGSGHHPGFTATGPSTPGEVSAHGHLPTRSVESMGQKQAEGQVAMDPSHHMHGHRLSHVRFGAASLVSTPVYDVVSSPTQSPYAPYSAPAAKRSRTEDFDLSVAGVSMVDQSGLDSVQAGSLGEAYGQAAAAAVAASHPEQPQLHHRRHLPDLGSSSKSMRREDMGGAPSMVGQAGMPPPAPRPRGPRLKFTPEGDQLLLELKEQKNLTWKQIADFFPGRSSGTLQVRYCTKLKAKTTMWTEEMDQKLLRALQDYENEKWRIVAHKVGSGFTPAACRERSEQFATGGDEQEAEEPLWQSLSPKASSLPESMEMPQTQRPL
ncbi:hypothetical protein PCL_08675 [Purpureocillium lilacinum]|uniref:Myb-like domain-containing protein n=1 Tax=Purpureocillium lilacinum TaxID=33203 RepID=A0A2U3DQY4_PURLI|nr:hypothetical protein PCL_08675 [Purpureocillium lilacinum]